MNSHIFESKLLFFESIEFLYSPTRKINTFTTAIPSLLSSLLRFVVKITNSLRTTNLSSSFGLQTSFLGIIDILQYALISFFLRIFKLYFPYELIYSQDLSRAIRIASLQNFHGPVCEYFTSSKFCNFNGTNTIYSNEKIK